MAMDVHRPIDLRSSVTEPIPEQTKFIPVDQYFNKFEEEERKRCISVNLKLLNEAVQSSDDEIGDVAEEFD